MIDEKSGEDDIGEVR